MTSQQTWQQLTHWWCELAERFGVGDTARCFLDQAVKPDGVLQKVNQASGNPDYVLFTLLRHWIPPVLPPPGRERTSKGDPDYWLESKQILKLAVLRLRELKPLIDLLTAPDPFRSDVPSPSPVVEVELANMLEGIAEVCGSYGGPDYSSIIKPFDPVPLRQTQPFKHNKKHGAELWVIFLLREHFKSLGMGKDRYWRLITEVISAGSIRPSSDQDYSAEELKSWWTKNWPRTYTLLKEKGSENDARQSAYQSDYEWFQSWIAWQMSRSSV